MIRIIALSQSNPLKATAEFVENSIDAHAKSIVITRGKEHHVHYLSVILGEHRELEPHADLRRERLSRRLRSAMDDPRPAVPLE